MKLLDRYLMAQFAKNLLLVLCGLVAIYLLVDFFERVDNFLAAGKSVGFTLKYLLFKTPAIAEQLIPACILLAGIITLGVLNRHFEFMALMAGGVSVFRIIRPLLVAAGLVTLLGVAVGQWLIPPTTAETNRIWHEEVNEQIPRGVIRDGRTYFRGTDGIFSFSRPNPAKAEFRNFNFARYNETEGLTMLLTAQRASWQKGTWRFRDGQIKEFSSTGQLSVRNFATLSHDFPEKPEDFFMPPYKIKELSYSRLFREASADDDGAASEARLEFHQRFSYIFLGLPLLLVGIPVLLSVHKNRGRDLALAIPLSCGMAFVAWGAWSAGQSLARTTTLPPGLASWAIHVLAAGLGLFLIHRHNR